MSKLKVLSGQAVIEIILSFGFEVVSQRGSHVKLRRRRNELPQTLTIPNHPEMDKGTLRAIYRQAIRYISEQDLYPHFYSE